MRLVRASRLDCRACCRSLATAAMRFGGLAAQRMGGREMWRRRRGESGGRDGQKVEGRKAGRRDGVWVGVGAMVG